MRRILAVDPGNVQTAWVLWADGMVLDKGLEPNKKVLRLLKGPNFEVDTLMAVEMVASYGMAVGMTVFETCFWIGRFVQAWSPRPWRKVYRIDVKMAICHAPNAKDSNIRQALLDLVGPQGTKREPGPTYGFKKDLWAALAVAVTVDAKLKGR
jgi:hypothetical protein